MSFKPRNPLDELLKLSDQELLERGIITAREIAQQPEMWRDTARRFVNFAPGLMNQDNTATYGLLDVHHYDWGVPQAAKLPHEIIFTGAGTSHFVGLCVMDAVGKGLGLRTLAIPTTDIVTHPEDAFRVVWGEDWPSILVSFARSGNSPESLAVIDIAFKQWHLLRHLVITCNPDGQLAKRVQTTSKSQVLVLHPATNDRGLAMTSSFTSMVIAGLGLAYLLKGEPLSPRYCADVAIAAKAAEHLMREYAYYIEQLINHNDFRRACFLGSGSLYGAAVESHLKLQELTDGQIICLADTFLGIRHGPRAAIRDDTLVVYFLSSDPAVRRYEMDLVRQNLEQKVGAAHVMVCANDPEYEIGKLTTAKGPFRWDFGVPKKDQLPDHMLAPVMTIVGQLLGFFASLKYGFKPDTPSASGSISRVVEGVTIYPRE